MNPPPVAPRFAAVWCGFLLICLACKSQPPAAQSPQPALPAEAATARAAPKVEPPPAADPRNQPSPAPVAPPAAGPAADSQAELNADDNWSPQAAFADKAEKRPLAARDASAAAKEPAKPAAEAGHTRKNEQERAEDKPADGSGEAQGQGGRAAPATPKPDSSPRAAAAEAKGKSAGTEGAAPRARDLERSAADLDEVAKPGLGTAADSRREPALAGGEGLQIRRAGPGGTVDGAGIGAIQRQPAAPVRSPDKIFRWLPELPSSYPRDARYRSNYLPGRGYLDHLAGEIRASKALGVEDSLVAPAPVRTLPAPTAGQSLRVAVDLSDKEINMAGGTTIVRVRLRGADQGLGQRGPLHLHLVLDSSGSMKGRPWQQVCAAVRDLSTRLGPADQLSVVHFGSVATILAPPTAGGPQLAKIADQVCALRPRGETNTYAGLQLGYQQARAAYLAGASNRVLLLSDGMPTIGPSDPYGLTVDTVRALGEGIVTSAIGVGNDFDALLMDRIALEGGGNHHFVRDAAALPKVLTDELELLAQQAAEAVDVRIRLPADIDLVEVVGTEPLSQAEALRVRQVEVAADQRLAREQRIAVNRQRDYDGGVRFLLPSFRAGDEHSFLLVVRVPAGDGSREVARVEVRYKDTINKKNSQFVGGRSVQFAPAMDREPLGEPEVRLSYARARAGQALMRASEYLETQNLPRIRQELYGAATALQQASDRTGSAAGHAEATRLQALADAAGMAMGRGQRAWLTTVFHYGWRTCGDTAWGG